MIVVMVPHAAVTANQPLQRYCRFDSFYGRLFESGHDIAVLKLLNSDPSKPRLHRFSDKYCSILH